MASRATEACGSAGRGIVTDWFRRALPGEALAYFTGRYLVKDDPRVKAADRLIAAGLVLAVQQKLGAGVYEYRIVKRRNAEPAPLSRAGVEEKAPKTHTDDESEQLIAVLRLLANRGQMCPTNAALADLACLKDAESARYRLNQLSIAGRISVVTPPQGPRVVTIVSSGRSTARC